MICNLPECSVEFNPTRRGHIFCCAAHQSKSVVTRTFKTSVCFNCGDDFYHVDAARKFCSRSCSAKSSNVSRVRYRKCRSCSQLVTTKVTYCDGCDPKFYIDRWILGLESGSNKDGQLKAGCRNYLLVQASHKCPQCGWSIPNPVTGKPILTINHIDGNWKNNCIENLEVLCYNCHTLTDTFGSLNSKSAGIRGSGPRSKKLNR